MPATRTLPIPAQQREFTVKVNGTAVDRAGQMLAASLVCVANRIATARLVYLDGSSSRSDFPLSNADTFVPGNTIEILAGSTDDPKSLFKGIVVRVGIKIREHTAPQLIVECRHAATKLTVGRKSAYFLEQKDSDVIRTLLERVDREVTVDDTRVTQKQMVQFDCTDWDFLLARAVAAGLCVLTRVDGVRAVAPRASGATACTVQYGSTLLEFDGEIDARSQFRGVRSTSWDPAQQSVVETDGADPSITDPGNLASADLADVVGLDQYDLKHPALGEPEAQAWADGTWTRSQLSRVSGRAKCEGIGTVAAGDVVELAGLGERFSGKVLVTGVRHEFDLVQGWKTHLQFGAIDLPPAAAASDVSAPPAGALLPSVAGLQIGVVVSNEDPDGEHRVRVRMPLVDAGSDGTWARMASPDAGDERGFFFRPEIGDEVVLGFLADDPRHAVILGMLHSSAKPAPLAGSDDNHEKTYQSRSKMVLSFNDEKRITAWKTPAGNAITLDEDAKKLTIGDQNGNSIELSADGITIESAKALTLKASTALKIESGTAFDLKGGTELKLQGTSGVELSSSAITKVKGSLVQLN